MAVVGITLNQLTNAIASVKQYVDENDVQSDWDEENSQSLSYILNKPIFTGGDNIDIRIATEEEIRDLFK